MKNLSKSDQVIEFYVYRNILENSNLNGVEELPDAVNQEDLLDKKKQEREKLGSVNLKAPTF